MASVTHHYCANKNKQYCGFYQRR